MFLPKKAQSTLEYTLIVAAIVAAVIAAAGHIQTKVTNSINSAGDTLENAANHISDLLDDIPQSGSAQQQ